MALTDTKTQIIVGVIGLIGVTATALIANWNSIFPDDKQDSRFQNARRFYITNEQGYEWAAKFSVLGQYFYDRQRSALVLRIERGSIRVVEPKFVTRLTLAACYESGNSFDIYPTSDRSSQTVFIGARITTEAVFQIPQQIIEIRGFDRSAIPQRVWFCGFVWNEITHNGRLIEANVPGHAPDRELIVF